MQKLILKISLLAVLLTIKPAVAAEQTVTLAIDNMYCAACPYIVKQALVAVPGVLKVKVSYQDKTAIVTYDDEQTTVETLTQTTFDIGYPSRPIEPEG